MELQKIMRGIELFRGLNDDQLRRLADISKQETFAENDVIMNVDSPGDRMYILADGQVEVRLPVTGSGALRPAVYLGEGQIFGEVALLDEGNRSATVCAAQDGTIAYSIPRGAFIQLCQADTGLGYLIMRNLALDLSFKLRHRNLENP
jgi:CRP/FNR family transcriptional regulator, cyclic AMP receptor protein